MSDTNLDTAIRQRACVQEAIERHYNALLDIANRNGGVIAVSVFLGAAGGNAPVARSTWRGINGEPDDVLLTADDRARSSFNGKGVGVGIAGKINGELATKFEEALVSSIAQDLQHAN